MKWGLVLGAGIALAACGGSNSTASPTTTEQPSASQSATASPVAVAAHFVTPDPSTAKIAANQSGVDPFSDFIGIHEVGLHAGQTVMYRAAGNASANYACNRTDGTLDSAPGSQQVASAGVEVKTSFVAGANGEVIAIIIVAPARPNNPVCPPGYAIAVWRSSYGSMTVTDETNSVTWSAPDSSSLAN